ncbi:SpoVA/SpoVAEb family sporulation membrane protein [Ruminococcus sp.]|uniref:SpoVA/SpoVAEb family sporulation membrane protein n=1 Tax=Ruminococcus sp. TaxID=41978 RepID=UPI0025DF8C17|nr:SpoVA/SpoVAEb family sporulation membrane protein [Ruminococcus sp.]MBQ8967118.1 SpoVA/SpoVAEb family sporulation membrane protein [Ruminococcus sp.]
MKGLTEKTGLTKARYKQMYTAASRPSKWYRDLPKAFIIGGLICTAGQGLSAMYTALGLSEKNSSAAVSITLIFLSVLLTALGLYEKIAKHAGAGTLVPITGFANSVCAPAMEFRTEGLVTGLGAKIFIICGPVILYGTLASIAYGLLYYLTAP